jgi:hypothetical protein
MQLLHLYFLIVSPYLTTKLNYDVYTFVNANKAEIAELLCDTKLDCEKSTINFRPYYSETCRNGVAALANTKCQR